MFVQIQNPLNGTKIVKNPLLRHPIYGVPLSIWIDTSDVEMDIRPDQSSKNIIADALSSIEIDSITKLPILNFQKFAEA